MGFPMYIRTGENPPYSGQLSFRCMGNAGGSDVERTRWPDDAVRTHCAGVAGSDRLTRNSLDPTDMDRRPADAVHPPMDVRRCGRPGGCAADGTSIWPRGGTSTSCGPDSLGVPYLHGWERERHHTCGPGNGSGSVWAVPPVGTSAERRHCRWTIHTADWTSLGRTADDRVQSVGYLQFSDHLLDRPGETTVPMYHLDRSSGAMEIGPIRPIRPICPIGPISCGLPPTAVPRPDCRPSAAVACGCIPGYPPLQNERAVLLSGTGCRTHPPP